MVIAAAWAMQKSHHILRAIAHAHAKHACIELDLAFDICGENDHMSEAARLYHRIAWRISTHAAAVVVSRRVNAPLRGIGPGRRLGDAQID